VYSETSSKRQENPSRPLASQESLCFQYGHQQWVNFRQE
jgi:hypothetical protein